MTDSEKKFCGIPLQLSKASLLKDSLLSDAERRTLPQDDNKIHASLEQQNKI